MREEGTSTRSWPARIPLRSRFSRSESGSLVLIGSPGRLHDARDVSGVRVRSETDAAEPELAEHAPGAAADAAAAHLPRHELRLPVRLDPHCPSCHLYVLSPMSSVLSPYPG